MKRILTCSTTCVIGVPQLVGKNLEYGLKQEGLLKFVRELNGNEEEPYNDYLRDASMYARGRLLIVDAFVKVKTGKIYATHWCNLQW